MIMFMVKWGPENAWATSFGQRARAEQHAEDLRVQWPGVEVVELRVAEPDVCCHNSPNVDGCENPAHRGV